MASEILSIAVFEPHPGQEDKCVALVHELYRLMHRKRYSRDYFYRDLKKPGRYVNLRYWRSPEARVEAQQDPDLHRMWAQLGLIMTMVNVYETLEELPTGVEAIDD